VTWDGDGTDPWLPARLDRAEESARLEAEFRSAFWAALSRWLVGTARSVLRGGALPDPDAVWSRVPAWRQAVEALVRGNVLEMMAVVYRRVMGTDDPTWRQRSFVTAYLAEVTDRMVRIPEEVFSLVAGQVAEGANLGESVPKLAARVDGVLTVTGSERWTNRATVVARTETIGALNGARLDAFRIAASEEPDVVFHKMWLSTIDDRTRPSHRRADGQRVPLEGRFSVGDSALAFPGDPTGPAHEVIQCRCSFLLVDDGEEIDVSDRGMRR